MAYVKPNQTKEVKKALEAKFTKAEGWEFSVTKDGGTLSVAIMRAPVQLIETTDEYNVARQYEDFNVFYLGERRNGAILLEIKEIANAGNFNNSDSQTDYFHVGFYLNISAGKWNKPFVYTGTPEEAEKAISDFIEAEVAKKGYEVVAEGAEGASRYQFSEKGVEREIFIAERKTAINASRADLTTLARQIVPHFPKAVLIGGGAFSLAETKGEDTTHVSLILRAEGFLDIYAAGKWISEKSPKFMRLYSKYFAPMIPPPATEEETPATAPEVEKPATDQTEAENEPEGGKAAQARGVEPPPANIFLPEEEAAIIETTETELKTSFAAPVPFSEVKPKHAREISEEDQTAIRAELAELTETELAEHCVFAVRNVARCRRQCNVVINECSGEFSDSEKAKFYYGLAKAEFRLWELEAEFSRRANRRAFAEIDERRRLRLVKN